MRKSVHVVVPAVVLLAGAAAWQLFAVRQHNPLLFPTVTSILTVSLPGFATFSGQGYGGIGGALAALGWNSLITVGRIVIGMAIGLPLGTAFGLLTFWLRGSGGVATLSLIVLRSIPLLALVPLFSFWFGSSGAGIISYIAFGVFLISASDAYEAAANLSPTMVQLAGLLGARGTFLARTVYLPGIAGPMLASVRNIAGLSLALSLGAEYVSANAGLGYLAYQSYLYADMGKLALLAALYMLLGFCMYALVKTLSRRVPALTADSARSG